MISVQLEEALAAIEGCQSLEELHRTMQRIVESHGFAAYCFVDAGDTTSKVPFYFGTTKRQWEAEYIANDLVKVDPAIAKVRRTNTPFVWADIASGAPRPGPRGAASWMRRPISAFAKGLSSPATSEMSLAGCIRSPACSSGKITCVRSPLF